MATVKVAKPASVAKPNPTKGNGKTVPAAPANADQENEKAGKEEAKASVKKPTANEVSKDSGKEKKPEIKESIELEPVKDADDVDVEEAYVSSAEDTNPEKYLYKVRVDNKTYEGRNPSQVSALVHGVLGAARKIQIERM